MAQKLNYKDFFDFNDSKPLEKAIDGISKLEDTFEKMVKSVSEQNKVYAKEIKNVEKEARDVLEVVDKLNLTFDDNQKQLVETAKASKALFIQNGKLNKTHEDNEKVLKSLNEELGKTKKAKEDLTKVNQEEAGSLEDLKKQLKLAEDSYKRLGNSVDDSIKQEHLNRVRDLSNRFNTANDALKKAKKAADFAAGSYNELNQFVLEGRKRLKEMAGGLEGNSEEFQQLQTEVAEAIEKLKDWDRALGDNFREVGNYKQAIKDAAEEADLFGIANDRLGGILGFTRKAYVFLTKATLGQEKAQDSVNKTTAFGTKVFRNLRKALVASGIGAIVLALGSLAAFFTQNSEGAQQFEKIMNRISATFSVLLGRIIRVGRALTGLGEAFSALIDGNFRQAGKIVSQVFNDVIDSFDGVGKEISEQIKRYDEITDQTIKLADKTRELEVAIARLAKTEEQQRGIADDATRAFAERERAAEKARQASEARARLEIELAQESLKLAQQRLDAAKAVGQETEQLLDDQAEATKQLVEAEKELFLVQVENEKQRRELIQDRLEKDLDILIDGFDNQKTINERIIADERKTLDERANLFQETVRLSNLSFNQQAATIQKFTEKAIDFNDLLATSDAVVLNQKIRQLGLSEIIEGRILEVIRERRIVQQDLAEIERDLTDVARQQVTNRIAAELELKEVLLERKIIENEIADEILGASFGVNIKARMALSKDTAEAEIELIENRYEEEVRLLEESIVDIEELNTRKKVLEERLQNDINEIVRKSAQERADIRKEEFEKLVDVSGEVFDTISDFSGIQREKRDAEREEELEKLEDEKNRRLEVVADDAQARAFIEEQFARRQAQIEKQRLQEERRAAIFEKAKNVAQATINTARAVVEVLPNIPLSIVMGTLGAVQIAKILATPIPGFWKGTKDSPEGWAELAERGREIVKQPGQSPELVERRSVKFLKKHSIVVPNPETEKILAQQQADSIFDQQVTAYKEGSKTLSAVNNSFGRDTELINEFRSMQKTIHSAIKSQPQEIYDEHGYRRYERNVSGRVQRLNKRYSLFEK